MAGGGRGGQAPSSIHVGSIVSEHDHINDVSLFLNSNSSELLPYDYNVNSADHARFRHEVTTEKTAMQYQQNSDQKLVNSHLSKGFSDETSSGDIFANKNKGKTNKKSNSTLSSNTSSSYSSSSGVESMTAGITGECNTISDKDKGQEICSAIVHSKETMYAVGQWLRFLQMDSYLQVIFWWKLHNNISYNIKLQYISKIEIANISSTNISRPFDFRIS